MTKRKLRKNADINPPQSPHDGIHTCSKGCSKTGCTRTLRDTIEEQDKQIEALKRDVLEKTAELRNLKEVVHELRTSAEDDLDSIETARFHLARLKAEVERLSKPAIIGGYNLSQYIRMANSETLEFDNGDIFADMTLPERIKYIVESHARLKAEVERSRDQYNGIIDTQLKVIEELKAEVERLTKAGDAMAEIIKPPSDCGTWIDETIAFKAWCNAKGVQS